MMYSQGELIKNKIIITRSKDIGRLYDRSHFGKKISNEHLELDLIEGIYLLSESKIRIFNKNIELKFEDLVKIAAKQIPNFEIKYLVFKDLRNRGHPIKLSEFEDTTDFYRFKQKKNDESTDTQFFMSVFSERDILDFTKTSVLIKSTQKKNALLWFAIVDEEGDITYYNVSSFDAKGEININNFKKVSGFLLNNRIVIFEKKLSEDLLKKEFFGKPFGAGLQLSLVESMYLYNKGILKVQTADEDKISKKDFRDILYKLQPDLELRFKVYKDLKKRGFIVKTGFKYGAHFRVYAKHIGKGHADYLIHSIDKKFKGTWADMSRAVRLAHSVNKEFVFAKVENGFIEYIKLGRLRP